MSTFFYMILFLFKRRYYFVVDGDAIIPMSQLIVTAEKMKGETSTFRFTLDVPILLGCRYSFCFLMMWMVTENYCLYLGCRGFNAIQIVLLFHTINSCSSSDAEAIENSKEPFITLNPLLIQHWNLTNPLRFWVPWLLWALTLEQRHHVTSCYRW